MKKLVFLIISILTIQYSSAQNNQCSVLLKSISGSYTGDCKNGLANGKGKSVGQDTYIGMFKDGLPHGKGKYLYRNGNTFQGYWKNGEKNGKGKYKYSLNGEKHTLSGYWKQNEYAGSTNPDIFYRISSSTGIMNYKVERMEALNPYDKDITFSIRSSFSNFVPSDLRIEKSSGKLTKSGKKFIISNYSCPLRCEISYTIKLANTRKQCRFIIDILEDNKCSVVLSHD
ncbi:hypothetical protein [Marinifilum caeruleilacunae]|uniref:MORN repeat protein n=1 Tax=Marinifilum caeruleilacunae TaxID=2499076 RepID=A0ABX1WZJ1_9BACT|nr:hypothetical protein [Marinifilum caeruleilacunae]NOU61250.1 hypothetical protein [Marinifilum caeruleilacunae]